MNELLLSANMYAYNALQGTCSNVHQLPARERQQFNDRHAQCWHAVPLNQRTTEVQRPFTQPCKLV